MRWGGKKGGRKGGWREGEEADLDEVGEEEGSKETAPDSGEEVDEGDAQPACQLLQVPHHCQLEHYRHQQVHNAVVYGVVWLVWCG